MTRLTRTRKAFAALMLLLSFTTVPGGVAESSSPTIRGRVIDATDHHGLSGATILIWDLTTMKQPKAGAGLYITDSEGKYESTAPYVKFGHLYRIYAYKGNVSESTFDYVPSVAVVNKIEEDTTNVSFSLIPGASIHTTGEAWYVESSSPPHRTLVSVLDLRTGTPPEVGGTPYVSEYGPASVDAWFLNLSDNVVVVPANTEVYLRARVWFYSRERGLFDRNFLVDNDQEGYTLEKGTSLIDLEIWKYSLRISFDLVNDRISQVSAEVDEASNIGFYTRSERAQLTLARQQVYEAQISLTDDPVQTWAALREAYVSTQSVHENLDHMRLISSASAVYLPAFLALCAVVIGFFFFDQEKKKLIATSLTLLILLLLLFFIYPGMTIIARRDMTLLYESAILSAAAMLGTAFLIPRLWKERSVEGEVSLKSTVSVLFSMAKRQIRRRKTRSFFALVSMLMLVMAFTSLTSFGTIYGLASESLQSKSSAEGIMVYRPGQDIIPFTPLGMSDLEFVQDLEEVTFASPRVENLPTLNPLGQLSTSNRRSKNLYGLLGVAPDNETRFSHLDETIVRGKFLSEDDAEGVLIGASTSNHLGLEVGDIVDFYARGILTPMATFVIRGIFDEGRYLETVDLNGHPIGPKRIVTDGGVSKAATCNGSDLVVVHWKKALELQAQASALLPSRAPQFGVLSRIGFMPKNWQDPDPLIRTLAIASEYDVTVSRGDSVKRFYLGFTYEAKGAAEIIVPLLMVVLNAGAIMLNAVYERRQEMKTLALMGLNPVHIGTVFFAEAIIIGLLGGGLGYLTGLGFYRVMTFFGEGLMVRPKLEWWWSVLGLFLALAASILSTVRPAMIAVRAYTPSMIRRVTLGEEEKERRKAELFKVFQARELSMPIKISELELPFFSKYFLARIEEFHIGVRERMEQAEEGEVIEASDGSMTKEIKFNHVRTVAGEVTGTRNRLLLHKSPKERYYMVRLISAPLGQSVSEFFFDHTVTRVHDIVLSWAKKKKQMLHSP